MRLELQVDLDQPGQWIPLAWQPSIGNAVSMSLPSVMTEAEARLESVCMAHRRREGT